MQNQDTIVAIATPSGRGGISVIRISGKDAVKIAQKVLTANIIEKSTHTVTYGHISDMNGRIIDECLTTIMLAPRTYTREDVVEISVHGSNAGVREAFSEIVKSGARPAGAGEFTKRAFMNGRIDLSQAEAVIDIINSDTSPALHVAVNQLGGGISERINTIRSKLVRMLAAIQVSADYADEGISEIEKDEILSTLNSTLTELKTLLETAKQGKIIREGIKTVIAGKPNSGKSSLLNVLVGEERAIVTDIAGTTRDIIEEFIDIGGVALRLMDTAGIRHTGDIIEAKGVERAKSHIKDADLVILVTDISQGIDQTEHEILEISNGNNVIIVANKTDLPESEDYKKDKNKLQAYPIIEISCTTGQGLDKLKQTIKKQYLSGEIEVGRDAMIINVRHQQAVVQAVEALENALQVIKSGMPDDLIFIDLQLAIEALGEITGLTVSDEVVDRIFKDFCVGK